MNEVMEVFDAIREHLIQEYHKTDSTLGNHDDRIAISHVAAMLTRAVVIRDELSEE